MQVYLPDELYDEVKHRGISPSELLQQAVRAELRLTALREATDRYVRRRPDVVALISVLQRDRWWPPLVRTAVLRA